MKTHEDLYAEIDELQGQVTQLRTERDALQTRQSISPVAYPTPPGLQQYMANLQALAAQGPLTLDQQQQLETVLLLGATIAALEYTHRKATCYQALWRARHDQVKALGHELRVTDELLASRQAVLDAIPPCSVHGSCVPHALDWIFAHKD